MAGREFSGLLGRQKLEILRMISDRPPEVKKRKLQDFEAPATVNNVPGVMLRKDGDLSLESRNKRMFKQLVGTLEDFEAPTSANNVPGVKLRKDGDLSLENRNKRMFKQLVGTLERVRKEEAEFSARKAHTRSLDSLKRADRVDRVAEYQPVPKRWGVVKVVDDNELKDIQNNDSAVDESVAGVDASHIERDATWPRNEIETPINYAPSKSLAADVPLTEKRIEQTREKAHEESERPRQFTNEQIAENERNLTVSTRVAATSQKELKVLHSKLQRIYRTKAEPQINYSFAKLLDVDVPLPLVEHTNAQGVTQVGRKINFVHFEKIGGKEINVLQGLELYTNVFGPDNQTKIVNCIYELQQRGRLGQLRGRTNSEPKKWMQGKGRITLQFGCCYNYATDKNGNPPGVIRNEEVEPLPLLFKEMIKKMVVEHIIPPTCVPDSCIVNIYAVGDCIPPHIDHHDFLRPFCTVSFLTECNILFGSNLEIVGAGKFKGPVSIPLPVGSVLIINGNGADIAKHCVPSVHDKRISITFRKMDNSKLPFNILPDPELVECDTQLASQKTRGTHEV